jgi:hypothetical protein
VGQNAELLILSLAVYMTKVQRSCTVWELQIMRYKNINKVSLYAQNLQQRASLPSAFIH